MQLFIFCYQITLHVTNIYTDTLQLFIILLGLYPLLKFAGNTWKKVFLSICGCILCLLSRLFGKGDNLDTDHRLGAVACGQLEGEAKNFSGSALPDVAAGQCFLECVH